MKPEMTLQHVFVDSFPEVLEERKLYVSIRFSTAAHNCVCGCGSKVITPLHPTKWRLTYDGKSISLFPSIGNWGYPCRSHYWIKRNKIIWSRSWSEEEVKEKRAHDDSATKRYFKNNTQ